MRRRLLNYYAFVTFITVAAFVPSVYAGDGYEIGYAAEAFLNAGSGDFAPYYMSSNRHGIISQSKNALLRLSACRDMNLSDRLSYGFGADFVGGYGSDAYYLRDRKSVV